MLFKILQADLYKKKIITILLALFVMISAFLIAISSNMIVELVNSLDYLFAKSNAPHYMQMSAGVIDPNPINSMAKKNPSVKKNQIIEMIPIDGAKVFIGNKLTPEENNVMTLDFVTQSKTFDFLLNLQGKIITVLPGEIAVPIYFMQANHLQIGDKITIKDKAYQKEFTIVDFLRDVQMNPAIVHSKRFLVSKNDFNSLKLYEKNRVNLIEFQLKNLTDIRKFNSDYQLSDLPKNGPNIDYNLYKILNSVTDGVTIGMIIGVSFLLTIVAIFCLRFSILSTMEEDYKQIGIMKAIGIESGYVKKLYLMKYIFIAGVACCIGYIGSLFLKQFFLKNIFVYLGTAPKSISQEAIPLFAVSLIFLVVIFSCKWILRKFDKITAVQALRQSVKSAVKINNNRMSLKKCNGLNINFFMGLRDVVQGYKTYILLFFVFVVCTFIVILPLNLLNTINSPQFITYMGIGRSDIRIDLRETTPDSFNKILRYLQNDKDVLRFAPIVTSRFKMINKDGNGESISIESGDPTIFPIQYLQGHAPTTTNEIALSYLNSEQLHIKMGDTINIEAQDKVLSAQDKAMLAQAKAIPAEDKAMPAEDKVMPAEDKVMPAEDKVMPAEDKVMPAEDKVMSAEDKVMSEQVTTMLAQDKTIPLRVSGIYQDITNGGKTGKALLPFNPETVQWYVVNIDFKTNVNVADKKKEYTKAFYPARVTYINDYLQQTLGDLIKQVYNIAVISIVVAFIISILITTMFLKLQVTKNYSQIAIMKAIGFSLNDIRMQYLVKALVVLNCGIILGTILSNNLGQSMAGLIWSLMGAPKIQFIIDPLEVYLLCPLLLMVVVTITTILSILYIKKINIIKMVVE